MKHTHKHIKIASILSFPSIAYKNPLTRWFWKQIEPVSFYSIVMGKKNMCLVQWPHDGSDPMSFSPQICLKWQVGKLLSISPRHLTWDSGPSLGVSLVPFVIFSRHSLGLPRWLSDKESACQCKETRVWSLDQEIAWKRTWQPTPIFLPEKSHGQRSLAG